VLDGFVTAYKELGLSTDFVALWLMGLFTPDDIYRRLDTDFAGLTALVGEDVSTSATAGLSRAALHILLEIHATKFDATKKDAILTIAASAVDTATKARLPTYVIEPVQLIRDQLSLSFDVSTIRQCNQTLRALKGDLNATALEQTMRTASK
jgi:hypothetical protein